MKRIICTFSGACYDASTQLLVERAQMGADEVMVFDDRWLIDSGFYRLNHWLFEDCLMGFGWCAWKAYVVTSALERAAPGDVVMYLDADTYPIAPFGHLFELCAGENGIYLFAEQGCSQLRFTKADCFLAMGLTVEEGEHACGRFSMFEKGSFLAQQVLAEWWAYSVNPRCMRWDRSILAPDPPEYHRNSTEQSVLSNLARKHGIPLHRTPDQAGGPDGQLFRQGGVPIGNRLDVSGSRYRNV